MKNYTLLIAAIQFMLISCSGNDKNKNEAMPDTPSQKEAPTKKITEKVEEEIDTKDIPSYSVAEFVDLFKKDKEAWQGKTVIIEGFCNGNAASVKENDRAFYSATLYQDKKFDRNASSVYFETKQGEPEPKNKGGKMKIKGKISGTFFDNPKMIDAQVIKNDEEISISATDSKDAKTYTANEFITLYKKDKEALKDKRVIIEGYYLNWASNERDSKTIYNLFLFPDEKYDTEKDRLFVVFTPEAGKPDARPKTKIKIIGTVTGEEFFDAARIGDAEMVK